MKLSPQIFSPGAKLRERFTLPKTPTAIEKPKVVLSRSKLDLAKRCTIHVIPIVTTILILVLNIRGVYIGADFTGPIKSETLNLLLLQIAAKIHELMIVGSLAVIVLHAVRYELLFGDGLPLGLIGSGISFSQLEFFFRKEFYGSTIYWFNHKHTARKICFIVLLIACGLITTLAGPSSATLLVPKTQSWPSGGTEYFLNGTSDDLWPIDLSGELPELQSMCNLNNSASFAPCPAAGFISLWDHWGRFDYSNFYRAGVPQYAKEISGSSFFWPIHSPGTQIPPRYAIGDARLDDEIHSNTYLAIPHAAPSALLQQVMTDWWSVIAFKDHVQPTEIDDRQASSTNLHAITSVRCSQPQNLSASATVVQFPSLTGRFSYAELLDMNITNMSTTSVNYLRFQWVHLPDEFGALSIGGLFESAWTNNDSRVVIACSAQAGWVPAQATTDKYSFWTGWYPWNVTFGERVPFFNAVPPGQPIGKTNGRIAMGNTWLGLLTPLTKVMRQSSRNSDPSTIESIFESAGLDEAVPLETHASLTDAWKSSDGTTGTRARLVEAIICSVIADGMSRYGSHRVYVDATNPNNLSLSMYQKLSDFASRIVRGQTALVYPSNDGKAFTTLRVNMTITGFSFQTSLAGFLAMAVLMTHLFMAATHMLWIIYRGETSGCWALVSELITLAYNSRTVAPSLASTGAGIHNSSAFGQVARIQVRCHPENPSLDNVELLFGTSNDDKILLTDMSDDHSHLQNDVEPDLSLVSTRTDSYGLTTLFDDRPSTTSTDTLISRVPRSDNTFFEYVKSCRAYG